MRYLKGLTQEGLGYESEIHRTYIAAVESGKRNISVEALENILMVKEEDILEKNNFYK